MTRGADIATYISLSGLLTLFSTCKDFYDLVGTVRNADDEIQALLGRIALQRILFDQWLKRTGFDKTQESEAGQAVQERGSDDEILKSIRDPAILAVAWNRVAVIVCSLAKIDQLLTSHTKSSNKADLPLPIVDFEEALQDATVLNHTLSMTKAKNFAAAAYQYVAQRSTPTRTFISSGSSVAWGLDMKAKLNELIDTIEKANDGLQKLLPTVDQDQAVRDTLPVILERLTDLKSTISMFMALYMSSTNDQSFISSDFTPGPVMDHMKVFFVKRQQNPAKEKSSPIMAANQHTKGRLNLDLACSSGIIDKNGQLSSDKRHWHASLRIDETSGPILVEVRRQLEFERDDFRERNRHLAELFQAANRKAGLQTHPSFDLPYFEGYIEISPAQLRQTGLSAIFAFRLPEETTSVRTLQECLQSDELKPCLGTRFRIAQCLVRSFYSFLALNWYHKGLRNSNVLFAVAQRNNKPVVDLSQPYVVGFGYSRPSDQPRQQVSDKEQVSKEVEIYRHREYRVNPEKMEYRIEYDMYSLGILLTEIAFWISSSSSDFKSCNLISEDRIKASRFRNMSFVVGENYASVVKTLLTGNLGECVEPGSIAWGQSFSENVVRRLDSCVA